MSVEQLHEYVKGEFQSVTRLPQLPAGAADAWIRDANGVKLAAYGIAVYANATGGTALILGTDYTLTFKDEAKSLAEGQDIYAGYRVLNETYQSVPLYFSMKVVGGYTDRRYRPEFIILTANGTVPVGRDVSRHVDTSSGNITVTLTDGERGNDQVTIISFGGNTTTIAGTGLTNKTIKDQGGSFVWSGSAWIEAAGAGGTGVPGDPALIKDWVEKFGPNQDPPSTPATKVTNTWGAGKYLLSEENGRRSTVIIVTETGSDILRNIIDVNPSGVGDQYKFEYDYSTNEFYGNGIGALADFNIGYIYRWEDVAGQDAQLNPPIDGWEEVYTYTETGTDTSVPNTWGYGTFEVIARYGASSIQTTFRISIDESATVNAEQRFTAGGAATEEVVLIWTQSTNTFSLSVAGSWAPAYFVRIRKFNGLVNVLHTYGEQVIEVDTTAGDIDGSTLLPSPAATGTYRLVCNIGTANRITNLPGSISLGAGKSIRFTYGGSEWKSEDVIIDEYTGVYDTTGTYRVRKWAGGGMEIEGQTPPQTNSITGNRTETFPEAFISKPTVTVSHGDGVARAATGEANSVIYSITVANFVVASGFGASIPFQFTAKGRWKT